MKEVYVERKERRSSKISRAAGIIALGGLIARKSRTRHAEWDWYKDGRVPNKTDAVYIRIGFL